MTELFIPHSKMIEYVQIGDEKIAVPAEGLTYKRDPKNMKPWTIALLGGMTIKIEPQPPNYEYVYVPNKKIVELEGLIKLDGTTRGPRGKTEYAVMPGGHFGDGSPIRQVIRVKGQEILVRSGRQVKAA